MKRFFELAGSIWSWSMALLFAGGFAAVVAVVFWSLLGEYTPLVAMSEAKEKCGVLLSSSWKTTDAFEVGDTDIRFMDGHWVYAKVYQPRELSKPMITGICHFRKEGFEPDRMEFVGGDVSQKITDISDWFGS